MTTPSPLVIRPPLWARIYVGAFMIFWVGAIVGTIVVHHKTTTVAVGGLFIVLGGAFAYRIVGIGICSEPGGSITMHNNFGTRRLTRGEVQEFRVSDNTARLFGQRGIHALLSDGTVFGLDVCRTPLRAGSARLSLQLDRLNAWLHSDTAT